MNKYVLKMPTVPGQNERDDALTDSLLDDVHFPADLRKIPAENLPQVSEELRQAVLDIVSETGGHLGSALGVVEMTVALHYVFDTPSDKLIWDVSHQCYPHKILTGRRGAMGKLRQGGGPSGFTNRSESEFDPFGAAHCSTSISAALGMATARDYEGTGESVVAIIGDGSMTAGMAFEGLNNVGASGTPVVIILNDNHMSIAPPSGALEGHLAELRDRLPDDESRKAAIVRDGLPSFAAAPTLFDNLGLQYAGPFDGHDVSEMVAVLEQARVADGPVLLHVLTEKGNGYTPAMKSDCKYHGVSKFDVETGELQKSAGGAPSYTSVFAKALMAEAEADSKIVAVTAAMPSGTGLDKFANAFPERCFDVGIAEQHAVTFCGGLATEGYKPFAAIYSTFLQRAYDQIVHDIAIQRLPVRFAIDRGGMVGADGVTHQGSYDITYLGCLPGMVLMAPADEAELMHMVATSVAIDDRPSAFRYPRGSGTGVALPEIGTALEIGRGRILREGGEIAILSYGSRLPAALAAADDLAARGFDITVADARFAKPIDDDLVARLVREHRHVITLEEGAIGGFSTQVMDSLARQNLNAAMAQLVPMYLPDVFIDHDTPDRQIARAGLDANAIAARALPLLDQGRTTRTPLFAVGTGD